MQERGAAEGEGGEEMNARVAAEKKRGSDRDHGCNGEGGRV